MQALSFIVCWGITQLHLCYISCNNTTDFRAIIFTDLHCSRYVCWLEYCRCHCCPFYQLCPLGQNSLKLPPNDISELNTNQNTIDSFVWQLYFLVKTLNKHSHIHIIGKKDRLWFWNKLGLNACVTVSGYINHDINLRHFLIVLFKTTVFHHCSSQDLWKAHRVYRPVHWT